jgi:hypothetical protein
MDYPPGTIGVLSNDLSRYAWFTQSLVALAMPPNTQILWVQGMWVAAAVNRLIRNMAPQSTWIMLLSDDHKFESDLLLRLLAHDVDVVAPLCALRSPPFPPSIFHETSTGYCGYGWSDLDGQTGLVPVPTYGGPGVVIKRRVLEAIGDPWFQSLAGEYPNEDLSFFSRCRAAGFQPYVDLDTPLGHCTSVTVYPHRDLDATWQIRLWSNMDICLLPGSSFVTVGADASEAK